MPLASATGGNAMLAGLKGTGSTNTIPYVSLHTGSPGTTGANEYAGVTRQACSWNDPSAGSMTNSSALSFTTDGTTPVTHCGCWSLVSGGVYSIGLALTGNVTAVNITAAAGALAFTGS